MIESATRHRITNVGELRELLGSPSERALRKQLAVLDRHCRAFIERSPFMLLGTANRAGRCDVSPKGDRPGFVHVPDAQTLLIPERPGNRRLDSLQNILENPHVGLLFLIPGMDETLRVNGTAVLITEPEVLETLAMEGKPPLLAIEVHVEEAFLHCARSFLRAQLWNPEHFMPRGQLPSLSRMLADQTRPADCPDAAHEQRIADGERGTAEAYRCLY